MKPDESSQVTVEKITNWKANPPVIEVMAGEWVTFDSKGLPARLWFPRDGQVMQTTPVNLVPGPVQIQTNPALDPGTMIPYVFFLTDVPGPGDWLTGASPPYIIIKDPRTPRGGGAGDTGDND